ncbi:phosphoglycerate dehydrogenase [bacterium]|nr:phosphoglycerate dehydrogenase [bacterium]
MNSLRGKKILIGPSTFAALDSMPIERLVQLGCIVIDNPFKRKLTKDELIQLLSEDVIGLVAGLEPLTRDVLESSELRVISRCGTGLSNVDLKAAKDLKIKVFNTPDAPTTAVAELTIGAMISTIRKTHLMDRDMHSGRWIKQTGRQLEEKTIVIIGFGRIGRKVARLLKGFNAKIMAVDPYLEGRIDGIEIISLKDSLAIADIITLHASGEDEIIGGKEFHLMKPGVILLNAGRGGMVNEDSLCKAIDEGIVAGAWCDSFSEEPYKGPLSQYEQVLLTPHVGSYSEECRFSMEMESVNNLIQGFHDLSNE